MSARRKKHACGHRGFGQWCHRCALADQLETRTAPHWCVDYDAATRKRTPWSRQQIDYEIARLRMVRP